MKKLLLTTLCLISFFSVRSEYTYRLEYILDKDLCDIYQSIQVEHFTKIPGLTEKDFCDIFNYMIKYIEVQHNIAKQKNFTKVHGLTEKDLWDIHNNIKKCIKHNIAKQENFTKIPGLIEDIGDKCLVEAQNKKLLEIISAASNVHAKDAIIKD